MEEKNESVVAPVAETEAEIAATVSVTEKAEDALPEGFFDEAEGEFFEEAPVAEEGDTASEEISDGDEEALTDNASVTDHATRAERDMAAIAARFPEMEGKTLADLPSPRRYGELRELGLSPEEAYLATLPRPRERADSGKAHLRTTAPRRTVSRATSMSHAEMRAASELFPGMSGRDILSLYKRVQA